MTKQSEIKDVVVVGGGAAGLAAGVTLARARRSVVVVDAGQPRNGPAAGVHGLLGLEGINPAELLARGRNEVAGYGGVVVQGRVTSVAGASGDFTVTLDDGQELRARQLVIATGLTDELPEVPGVRERFGRDVLHCPYCHGWEVRDQVIGVIGTSAMSIHQALLFSQWSANVRLFAWDLEIPDEERTKLEVRGVEVVEGAVEDLEVTEDSLRGVRLGDGSVVPVEAVVVTTRMRANLGPFGAVGVALAEHPMGGSFIEADAWGRTAVDGIWVAGNATDLSAQVGPAAAQGTRVAAQVNYQLLNAETERAVAARQSGRAVA